MVSAQAYAAQCGRCLVQAGPMVYEDLPPLHPWPTLTPAPLLQVMRAAAASERGLTFPEYRAALEGVEVDLHVEVPVED